MSDSGSVPLQVEDRKGGIRLIGLDRPAKRNAINVEMTLALEAALMETRLDRDIDVVVFHGLGGHFCAGMDLKDFFDSTTRAPDELRRARAATEHWRTRLLRQMPQVLVTAVQGYCLGGAMPFLAASRIVVAERATRFGLPEINFGFVPGGQIIKAAGAALSPRALSYSALTGRPFDSAQAKAWGLVSEIVDGDPLEHAVALARQVAARVRMATAD